MDTTRTLYRPTGLPEMALIFRSSLREFPPRLPHQPIFYPVLTYDYAVQIARDWNAKDSSAGNVGFVTRFDVEAEYISRFEEHVVGSASVHRELWVPAEELAEFNRHIVGIITPVEAFYGEGFEGPEPVTALVRRDPVKQFLHLALIAEEGIEDFRPTILTNVHIVLLNFKLWAQTDFSALGLTPDRKLKILRMILKQWREAEGRFPYFPCDPVGADLVSMD